MSTHYNDVSNHQKLDCLLNSFIWLTTKKSIKLDITSVRRNPHTYKGSVMRKAFPSHDIFMNQRDLHKPRWMPFYFIERRGMTCDDILKYMFQYMFSPEKTLIFFPRAPIPDKSSRDAVLFNAEQVLNQIQSSAVITRTTITWYCPHRLSDWDRI